MHALSFRAPSARRGFTLVEVLVATVLVLIMLATVVSVFASMSDSMKDSRAMIEVNDRVRYTKDRLQLDLAGVTVPMLPPRRPESGEGYFEYIEGPVGPILPPLVDLDNDDEIDVRNPLDPSIPIDGKFDDMTLGDNDDVLMFTTRTASEPFVGRLRTTTALSQVAEVCWFLRGTTLYRRQLLVAPGLAGSLPVGWDTSHGFYEDFDLSARQEGGDYDWRTGGASGISGSLKLNTLGDLTKRENRYGHQPWAFPHDARFWGGLVLPTLRECSSPTWPFPFNDPLPTGATAVDSGIYPALKLIRPRGNLGIPLPLNVQTQGRTELLGLTWATTAGANNFDAWQNPNSWDEVDVATGTLKEYYATGTRLADDVILTNVLSFDVKAWDPGAPLFENANGELIGPSGEYPEHYNFYVQQPFFSNAWTVGAATNPIGFGAYVDLNYLALLGPVNHLVGEDTPLRYPPSGFPPDLPQSHFYGPGNWRSRVAGAARFNFAPTLDAPLYSEFPDAGDPTNFGSYLLPAVFDTWSTHYEHDGFDQDDDGDVDEGTNGFDDDGIGGVDDDLEKEAPPPYPVPLRGIQVKIRVFDPGTRQIREVTVVQDFVAQ